MRIEFSRQVKQRVAERNGFRCSFPRCDRTTIGPAESAVDSVSTGVACHIYSAAEGELPHFPGDRDYSLFAQWREH